MKFPIIELPRDRYPPKLLEIPGAPKQLYIRGVLPDPEIKLLAVVGARHFSSYGKEVCDKLIEGLSGEDIAIVSGLALGIDSLAHEAALKNNLKTIAIPGSGIHPSVIYPVTHRDLAEEILEKGGALLSEYDPLFEATPVSFPARNRIMAGLSDATLIIEGETRSGTMITARLATEYNRDVLAVPGNIFSKNSEGPHLLIRAGATPVTSVNDILEALGLKSAERPIFDIARYKECSAEELRIIEALTTPLPRDDLLEKLAMPISQANSLLTILELKDLIKEAGGEIFLK